MDLSPSNTTPVRTKLRLEIHAAILDAAESVFSQEGLDAGRMEQVAQRAGVAVGTLYNHFRNREALLQTLLATRRQELLRRVDDALVEAGPSFEEQLWVFVDTALEQTLAHRPLFSLLVQEDHAPIKARLLPPPGERTLDLLIVRARRIVSLGLKQGALRRRGQDLWPVLLVSSLRCVLVRELSSPSGGMRHPPGRLVVDFFLRGAGEDA